MKPREQYEKESGVPPLFTVPNMMVGMKTVTKMYVDWLESLNVKLSDDLSKLTEENATLRAENERFGKRLTARVICLCGSTRFTEQMLVKQWELTKQGHIVVSWCALPDSYFGDGDKTHVGDHEGVKEVVDEVHKRKIDLCDEVFVMNVGDYVGHSTMSEIRYAYKIGKPISFLEEPKPRNPENVNDPDLPQPFPWELL